MSKFAIGTAQFGMEYGINSSNGRVEIPEINRILNYAKSINIDLLDTASSYGVSEEILGKISDRNFKIITKTRHFKSTKISEEEIALLNDDFSRSLTKLNKKFVYGLLVHNSDDLFKAGANRLFNSLMALKEADKIKKVGVSVYDLRQLDFVLENFNLDIVQLPLSIFDRRMVENGMLSYLNSQGIEVHARSIFLQGLLLIKKNMRPEKFSQWNKLWDVWDKWLIENDISPLEASVRFVNSFSEVSKIIVGVETTNQLIEINSAAAGFLPSIPDELFTTDEYLLNPSNWKQL